MTFYMYINLIYRPNREDGRTWGQNVSVKDTLLEKKNYRNITISFYNS
jgi:hypothetical protein